MGKVTLMSLDDDLLDCILGQLVKLEGVQGTISTTCTISKRFSSLLYQPLTAWESLRLNPTHREQVYLSRDGMAHWLRWLATVAPAVKTLDVALSFFQPLARMSGDMLDVAAFLPPMVGLEVRSLWRGL